MSGNNVEMCWTHNARRRAYPMHIPPVLQSGMHVSETQQTLPRSSIIPRTNQIMQSSAILSRIACPPTRTPTPSSTTSTSLKQRLREGLLEGNIGKFVAEAAIHHDLADIPTMPHAAVFGVTADARHSRESYVDIANSAIDDARQNLSQGERHQYLHDGKAHTVIPIMRNSEDAYMDLFAPPSGSSFDPYKGLSTSNTEAEESQVVSDLGISRDDKIDYRVPIHQPYKASTMPEQLGPALNLHSTTNFHTRVTSQAEFDPRDICHRSPRLRSEKLLVATGEPGNTSNDRSLPKQTVTANLGKPPTSIRMAPIVNTDGIEALSYDQAMAQTGQRGVERNFFRGKDQVSHEPVSRLLNHGAQTMPDLRQNLHAENQPITEPLNGKARTLPAPGQASLSEAVDFVSEFGRSAQSKRGMSVEASKAQLTSWDHHSVATSKRKPLILSLEAPSPAPHQVQMQRDSIKMDKEKPFNALTKTIEAPKPVPQQPQKQCDTTCPSNFRPDTTTFHPNAEESHILHTMPLNPQAKTSEASEPVTQQLQQQSDTNCPSSLRGDAKTFYPNAEVHVLRDRQNTSRAQPQAKTIDLQRHKLDFV